MIRVNLGLNILGFVGYIISVAVTQFCYCNLKAFTDYMQRAECAYVPINIYFQK